MRLEDVEESRNVEDRRGAKGPGMAVGGGLGAVVIALIAVFMGASPQQAAELAKAGGAMGGVPQAQVDNSGKPISDEGGKFVSKVLRETEDVWTKIFAENGKQYQVPNLVIFSDRVQSGCGIADAGMGPFYCPADSKVYIDLSFYETMRSQLGASGDFAQAYVIAHEVGHHVQNLLGATEAVDRVRRTRSETEANAASVRLELQADFYAGLWAHYARNLKLDRQDIEEAMNAANAIGDDTLQKRSQGHVNPDSFTHGSSAQRVRWFMKGYQSGDISQGDTFSTRQL